MSRPPLKAHELKRCVIPKPGLRGWAHGERGHGLPEGLPHRTPVEVLERTGWRDLIVRSESGLWQVPAAAIDCGREYLTKSGKWIPETEDRARRFLIKLREAIFRHDRDRVYVHDTFNQLRDIADVEWILERNGWEPPPLSLEDRHSPL